MKKKWKLTENEKLLKKYGWNPPTKKEILDEAITYQKISNDYSELGCFSFRVFLH